MHKSGKSSSPPASIAVRSERTGQVVTVKGVGALRQSVFAPRKGIDLTRPIAQQALRSHSRTAKAPSAG